MAQIVKLVIGLALTLIVTAPSYAQDQTLADIRQEMTVLYVEVQRLKRELSTTGGVNTNIVGGSALERIDGIERELQRLTAKTEELEFRINRVVEDGTNRIGDLEFRLVELEGGDVGQLGETTTLGGDISTQSTATVPQPSGTGSAEFAVGEKIDFDLAKAALDQGSFQVAVNLFEVFTQTYTSGPLTGQAHYHRGEALSGLGLTTEAARAFLESYSGSPESPVAPDALYRLGASLGELGQINEACVTLGQVGILYPGAVAIGPAQSAMQSLECG